MCDEQVLLLALALTHCHARILPNPRSSVDLDQVFRSPETYDLRHGLLGLRDRSERAHRDVWNPDQEAYCSIVPAVDRSLEHLWDSLFAVVEGAKKFVVLRDPSGCLRREENKPRIFERSYFSAVEAVVNSPHRIRRPSAQVPSLSGGRLLVYFPDEDLADGAAEAESEGFFDVHNAPPWDTWVAIAEDENTDRGGPYLVSWVPPEFLSVAEAGIYANPEQCIRWLDDTDVAMRRICAKLRAG